jgi:DNA end-binding protein Ku
LRSPKLIESLTRDFQPADYHDEYREQLMALIERKAEGEDVLAAAQPEEPQPTKAPDLMAALEESIAAVKGKEDGQAKRRKPAAKKKGKAKAAPKRSSSRAKAKSSR